MSTSTVSNSAAAPLSLIPTRSSSSEEASTGTPTRSQRSTMSSGKGRRRRAAAEQRRAEQQHWSQMMHESEEDIYVAPPPAMSRRQMRRRAAERRSSHMDFDADGLLILDDDDELELELDVALAISLSLSGTMNSGVNLSRASDIDMSYENLVMLENVKCTAPPSLVSSLTGHIFKKGSSPASMEAIEELCTICQNEFKDGDVCMHLPCLHTLHDACGSEWFLNHSKLCPVCKIDVTQEDEVGHS